MKKNNRLFVLFLIAAPVLLIGCMFMGASQIGLPDFGTATGKAIIFLRANRIAGGFFVGAALACAGVVFQALLRNPLAEPYVLGVSSGAGLGAAICILFGFTSAFALPMSAFIAASLTLAIVFALANDGGTPSVYGLILSGVIVSAICSSILMFLVARAPVEGLHSVIWWMLGNLQPTSGKFLAISSCVIAFGCAMLWIVSPELNALTLGRETAHNIGVRTNTVVVLGLGLATLITAVAVGMSGLIGFVGLVVPHAMRNLTGPDHRRLIPASAIAGGVFLAVCDALARTVIAPIEVPVGVVTALFGGPFFLVVLRRKRKFGWME